MSDRMTIVGSDGKDRYVIDETNNVTDLRYCHCPADLKAPTMVTPGEPNTCLVCGLPIKDI